MLSSKEYRYFFQICRTYGYSCDEFEISNEYFARKDGTASSGLTTVTIRHIRLTISKKYMAGCGLYWLTNFESDLQACGFTLKNSHTDETNNASTSTLSHTAAIHEAIRRC